MAEFDTPERLVWATERAYHLGYRKMDAYTPWPVEGLADALGMHRSIIPWCVLIMGIIGGLSIYLFEVATMGIWYPINVGGRPYNSILSFFPPTFEVTILFASLTAVTLLIVLNKLPQPYHPVFNVPSFARASTDRFFLVIERADPRFDPVQTPRFLRELGAEGVFDVPA
jgi:hypothetical protein